MACSRLLVFTPGPLMWLIVFVLVIVIKTIFRKEVRDFDYKVRHADDAVNSPKHNVKSKNKFNFEVASLFGDNPVGSFFRGRLPHQDLEAEHHAMS